MLRYLAAWLTEFYSGFNVFNYLTLRAILAALTALSISFLIGPVMIRKLAEHQVGQRVRSDGPQTHLTKAGTPPWVARSSSWRSASRRCCGRISRTASCGSRWP